MADSLIPFLPPGTALGVSTCRPPLGGKSVTKGRRKSLNVVAQGCLPSP